MTDRPISGPDVRRPSLAGRTRLSASSANAPDRVVDVEPSS